MSQKGLIGLSPKVPEVLCMEVFQDQTDKAFLEEVQNWTRQSPKVHPTNFSMMCVKSGRAGVLITRQRDCPLVSEILSQSLICYFSPYADVQQGMSISQFSSVLPFLQCTFPWLHPVRECCITLHLYALRMQEGQICCLWIFCMGCWDGLIVCQEGLENNKWLYDRLYHLVERLYLKIGFTVLDFRLSSKCSFRYQNWRVI